MKTINKEYTNEQLIINALLMIRELEKSLRDLVGLEIHYRNLPPRNVNIEEKQAELTQSIEDNKKEIERQEDILNDLLDNQGVDRESMNEQATIYIEKVYELSNALRDRVIREYKEKPLRLTSEGRYLNDRNFKTFIEALVLLVLRSKNPVDRLDTLSEFEKVLNDKGVKKLIEEMESSAKEVIDSERLEIEDIKTRRPSIFVSPESAINRALHDPIDFYNKEQQELFFTTRGEDRINCFMSLRYEGEDIETTKPLTAQDRDIMNAVITLFCANSGAAYVTPEMIQNTLAGNKKSRPKPSRVNEIKDSLYKLASTRVIIDATQIYNLRGKDISPKYNGYLLPLEWVENISINGQLTSAYMVVSEPVLYKYSSGLGQVINIPIEYFDIPKVQNTADNISIKYYVLKRLQDMKRPGRRTYKGANTMLLNAILKNSSLSHLISPGSDQGAKQKRSRVIKTIEQILSHQVEQGHIKNYNLTGKGTETKFDIVL